MAFYEDMQNIASNLLTEFKQGVIEYGRLTPGAGPADDPGASSIAWQTLKGAVARGVSQKYIALSLAVATDKQITMSAELVPDIRDKARIDGEELKIVHIVARPAAGTVAAYTLIVRKG